MLEESQDKQQWIGEAMNQAAVYLIGFLLHVTGRAEFKADPVKSYSETEESALQLWECKSS